MVYSLSQMYYQYLGDVVNQFDDDGCIYVIKYGGVLQQYFI